MKKLAFLFVIGVFALTSQASYLYWQVDPTDTGVSSATAWANGYDYATVWAVDGDGNKVKLGDGTTTGAGTSTEGYVATFNGRTGQIVVDVSNFAGTTGSEYSFYIELASSTVSSGTMTSVATTTAQTYADLALSGAIQSSATLSDVPQAAVWHGGSGGYSAAPEPTSAMLMLLGVAGLALRRKQRKLA